MAELLAWDGNKLTPAGTVSGDVACVLCWDEDAGEHRGVPVADAGQGMLEHARTLTPGSAERAEVERQGITLLEHADQWPPGKRKQRRRG